MKLNLIFLLLLVISVLVLTADFGIDNDLKIPLAWEKVCWGKSQHSGFRLSVS